MIFSSPALAQSPGPAAFGARARRLRRSLVSAVIVGGLAAASGLHAQGAPPAPKVTYSTPLLKRVTNWDEYTGRFEASQQVEIRARVSGNLDAIHFKDGQLVKKGDLLFTIDPRPYAIAVESSKAEIARAKAQVLLAQNEVDRAEPLFKTKIVTERDFDQRRANLSVAIASQQAAEAALRNAELNLEWTEVRAPISGRVSDKRLDVGNLIAGGQANSTLLTTIVTLDPINFVFEASEADYLRYSRLAASQNRGSSRDVSNPVQVKLADETDWKHEGKMNFVDNQLNSRAGTIRGRAVFSNADQFLTPGTFGRGRLYGGETDAMLIPDSAIVSDQANKIVLTVGPENKIVAKPVTLGQMDGGLRVIQSGLKSEDKVVITGLANPAVRPGAVVDPQSGEIKQASR
ncbi:MAG: efflux RND transporter periplasmic adaptor subunit [Beijerinckiaceae bacterium]|nr:efflux RND transporter periplasmic adaptor subunit [Beijerinckiaceae bacterium]